MQHSLTLESLKKRNTTIKTPLFITLTKTSNGYAIANNSNNNRSKDIAQHQQNLSTFILQRDSSALQTNAVAQSDGN